MIKANQICTFKNVDFTERQSCRRDLKEMYLFMGFDKVVIIPEIKESLVENKDGN